MILLRLTPKERDAALFAIRSDLETVSNAPEEFGDDEAPLRALVRKLENTRSVKVTTKERNVEPCPVCEMAVNIGLGSKDDKVMVTTDDRGNFAGAVAVHGKCEKKFKAMNL